jgi:hypothetical protein
MEAATKLLNESRAKLAELDRHVVECEGYVRRMIELTVSRKPARESEERVARAAFLALAELSEVRDRWKAAYAALEQLSDAAESLRRH